MINPGWYVKYTSVQLRREAGIENWSWDSNSGFDKVCGYLNHTLNVLSPAQGTELRMMGDQEQRANPE